MARPGRLGPRRPREGDPRGLRGESRGARRPPDRPLPPPRPRPANAVADIGPRARPARRRRPRVARRPREREPRPVGRSARARSGRRGAGCAERGRRPGAPRRPGRAMRRDGHRADRAFAARRPRRAAGLARRQVLREVAEAHGSTPAEVALAWLLGLGANVVAIPGARRPETARSAARAATLELGAAERERLVASRTVGAPRGRAGRERGRARHGDPRRREEPCREGVRRGGYVRLNRDERGGTLRALATSSTRRSRRRAAGRPRQHVRDPRLAQPRDRRGGASRRPRALRVARHAARAGAGEHGRAAPRAARLPPDARGAEGGGAEQARPDGADVADAHASRARTARRRRGLRPIERVPFSRAPQPGGPACSSLRRRSRRACGTRRSRWSTALPRISSSTGCRMAPRDLDDAAAALSSLASGIVERAVCPHGAGPPACWCRPPLPGLPLAFARAHGVDPARAVLVGTSSAHRTLATTLGARFVGVGSES